MDSINISIFQCLNAGAGLAGQGLAVPVFLAEYLIWLVPTLLIFLWFRLPAQSDRLQLLRVLFSAMLALGVNQVIGLFYQHPRPFMMGLGHTYLPHAADSSFPSDHVTVLCAVGLSLLLEGATRQAGTLFIPAALAVAWARIYLGVHFPFDMVGALGTAAASVAVICLAADRVDTLVNRPLLRLYTCIARNRSTASPPAN